MSRPAGYNLVYIREGELNQKYKLVPKSRAKKWWQEEQQKIPPTERKTVHLLSGALLPIWKYLKKLQQNGLNIVRTTTDDGTRLVGVNIASSVIGEIRRTFGLWKNSATTAEEILRSVAEENESVELVGDIKIRKTRFQGRSTTEVCPASYEQVRELRETGLINIVQNSKQRFFISENEESAREALEKVLRMYPLFLLKSQPEAIYAQNTQELKNDHYPAELPGWLIEPSAEEIERICFRN